MEQLPVIRTKFEAAEVREVVDRASRRGKIPGVTLEQGSCLFKIVDFGHPFESVLEGRLRPGQGPSTIAFAKRLKPGMPILYALLLGVSIWPGIWLTDSMLRAYFSWYRIPTWWWYLPLTVPTSPWAMWVAVKKSRATGNAAGLELIQKIAAAVNGEVVMEPTAKPDLAATVQCST